MVRKIICLYFAIDSERHIYFATHSYQLSAKPCESKPQSTCTSRSSSMINRRAVSRYWGPVFTHIAHTRKTQHYIAHLVIEKCCPTLREVVFGQGRRKQMALEVFYPIRCCLSENISNNSEITEDHATFLMLPRTVKKWIETPLQNLFCA